ncbi:MAG: single-stranded-DNA-specific exonuclease RecJ [Alphaproteobacteria bacterium 40-19]|nr:MAG: single-stranded-DNA-specific exonuclease RecJ [Alphaproteobacteria bacterium 40-19]
MIQKDWLFNQACEKDVAFLVQQYGVSDLVARLAVMRVPLQEADSLFSPLLKSHLPDPCGLPDLDLALEHLYDVFRHKRPLGIWGDYDVDGACASALLVQYCRQIGHPFIVYIPDRFEEGYGPSIKGMKELLKKGVQDVVIVDCGSTALEVLKQTASEGIAVTVIDHHKTELEYPICRAFLNPQRWDFKGPESLKTLCAGALTFLFLVGVNRFLREKGFFKTIKEPDLFPFLDLVALSTVCDVMPLRGLNRAFVAQGLKVLGKRQNVGLTRLMDVVGIQESPNVTHLGYMIGPRINAGGRIGDSSLGVRLLSCQDELAALEMAQELQVLNQQRQKIEKETIAQAVVQAMGQEDHPFLFLWDPYWHEGVLGIVAGRLKALFHKPTFVLSGKAGLLKGSARSIPGIDIGQMIHQGCVKGLLKSGGGHAMAGGLMLDLEKLELFKDFLRQALQSVSSLPKPFVGIDMVASLQQFKDPAFAQDLCTLEPFGTDYPAPRFLIKGVSILKTLSFGQHHLRLDLIQGAFTYPVLFFSATHHPKGKALLNDSPALLDVVVSAQVSTKWGKQTVNLFMEDYKLY